MAKGRFDADECVRTIMAALDSRSRNPHDEKRASARASAVGMAHEIERLRGERFDVTDSTVRELALAVSKGLTVLRDADDEEEGWQLPDLVSINKAFSSLTSLVQHAADRGRFKRALLRLSEEADRVAPAGIRGYVSAVVSGGGSWKTSPLDLADSDAPVVPISPAVQSAAREAGRCPRCRIVGGHTELCPLRSPGRAA